VHEVSGCTFKFFDQEFRGRGLKFLIYGMEEEG
jgi:hypothetical protein